MEGLKMKTELDCLIEVYNADLMALVKSKVRLNYLKAIVISIPKDHDQEVIQINQEIINLEKVNIPGMQTAIRCSKELISEAKKAVIEN